MTKVIIISESTLDASYEWGDAYLANKYRNPPTVIKGSRLTAEQEDAIAFGTAQARDMAENYDASSDILPPGKVVL